MLIPTQGLYKNPQFVKTPNGDLVLPKTSGVGVKVDEASPVFGWRDITSDIIVKATGVGSPPTLALFRTNIYAYQFSLNDECWINFHIPHDYVPGSELYIHTHWGVAAAVSANACTWSFDASFAKRHDTVPVAFPTTTNKTVAHDASAINLVQYAHVVSEVQLTDGAGALGGNAIEVDGMILCHVKLSANTLGIDPFLFFVDIHYQSNNMATKNRAPNFYS